MKAPLLLLDVGHFAADLRPNPKARAMSLDISSKPMCVLIDGHDSEGGLILADSHLAPVFVRRDGTHHDPGHRGRRHLEAGFGKCDIRNASLFETPQGAGAWVERTLIRRTA